MGIVLLWLKFAYIGLFLYSLAMNADNLSPLQEALGQSEALLDFQDRLSKVAKIQRPVLIIGERGTGKELAAARLHYLSGCWDGPLVTLNCATLNGALLDSELFGHEVGAFTGAVAKRRGRFELADGGSLFLDEIASLPMEAQEKMLRVVEYGCFERVGGSQRVQVHVRLIGATNADLPTMAREGKFKADLLDRLSFEVLTLPPLREREGDVEVLARHFATRMAVECGLDLVPRFSDAAMVQLLGYHWPGNVRELKSVVERAVYRAERGVIDEITLNPFVVVQCTTQMMNGQPGMGQVAASEALPSFATSLPEAVRKLEADYLDHALKQARFNQRKAAALMGLGYHQFRALYRKHQSSK